MLPDIVVKCFVVNDEGKLLILRRQPHDENRPGEADLPGGGLETGENMTTTVIRELQEETGLIAQPDAIDVVYAATDETKNVVRIWALCREYAGEVALSAEHDAFWWKNPDEAGIALEGLSWVQGLHYAISHELI